MLINNYHTHTKYCGHAKGDVEDYVKEALNLNMEELGISDHAPIPLNHGMTKEEWEENYCYENMDINTFDNLLKEIDNLKSKYNIKLYKGCESEYLYNNDDWYKELRSKLDYMILGIHFFNGEGRVLDTYKDINYKNVDCYYECAKRAIETGLFDYLAHPDLYLFDYKSINGKNEFDAKAKEICLKLIDLCVKHDIYFEINTNGLKYSKDKNNRELWLYPNIEFFKVVKEYMDKNPNKLKLIIGADAHEPKALGNDNVKAVLEMVKDLKLDVLNKMEIK
ncbi:MAG: histidinol-phosphatase [Acholeplasmatales bacterium]|nr:histidinol-phosphatase [Acholeplasmatales bacterium]